MAKAWGVPPHTLWREDEHPAEAGAAATDKVGQPITQML